MREDVLRQLPKSFSKGTIALVVGAPEAAGLKSLVRHIRELNHRDDWIKWEDKEDLPASLVSTRVGIVLTLVGVKSGTLVNMKSTAEKRGIPCIRMPLTISEARTVLTQLSIMREGKAGEEAVIGAVVAVAQANGSNGSKGSNGGHTDGSHAPRFVVPAFAESESGSPAAVAEPAEADPVEDRKLDQAFEAIERFQRETDGVLQAIFAITEECKAAKERCAEVEGQMAQKDKDYARLQEENTRLRAENAEYKSTLDGFESLLKRKQGR